LKIVNKYLFLLLGTGALFAQQDSLKLDFSLLRQNDQVFVEKPGNFYQKAKYLRLGKGSSLSFGGSYRFQVEGFVNEQFDSEQDQNDAWVLNRFMFHAHLRVNEKLQLFAELNSSVITSKTNLSPVDKDDLAINQLFVTYVFSDQFNAVLGRQNKRLGSGRLVDIREGPNVRLSFDMLELNYAKNKTFLKSFFAVPVIVNPGVFDNEALNFSESLTAFYWTQLWERSFNTDIYFLYKREDNKTWNAGTADDNRGSIGLRHFGTWKGFNYNNEFVYQFGSFGSQSINAWTVSFNVQRWFQSGARDYLFGLKTEAISGDRADDGNLSTFDALYPRGAYFGRVARFGPSNLIDVHPYFATALGRFNLELDYVAFWRFSNEDGVYNPALILQYPSVNDKYFIGHQVGTILGIEPLKNLALELETNLIFPGGFLVESDLSDTLFHGVFTLEYRF
jgi:hypothetical protein